MEKLRDAYNNKGGTFIVSAKTFCVKNAIKKSIFSKNLEKMVKFSRKLTKKPAFKKKFSPAALSHEFLRKSGILVKKNFARLLIANLTNFRT